ncbi:Cysteine protease family c01a [Globisporangium polare]
MRARASAVVMAVGVSALLTGSAAVESSVGTLVSCPLGSTSGCLWMGNGGRAVQAAELRELLIAEAGDLLFSEQIGIATARRNLAQHMAYAEQVHRYAQQVGHAFSFKMGVHARHLLSSSSSSQKPLPETFVHREMHHSRSRVTVRQLATVTGSRSSTVSSSSSSSSNINTSSSLNWCTSDNPHKRSVCSGVKSQKNCGSCWAFAASDAIETAVAIAANQSAAVALAPQQFLSCSKRETEQTFTYCWVGDNANSNSYATWLGETMKWKSTNNGCSGGMTHGAFMDAAQLHYGLVTELEMPYVDSKSSNTSSSSSSSTTCVRASNQSAASISDWKQVVGRDCSLSRDPNVLLRKALQTQPIAVAMNSEYPFADYKGGFYSCPHNGDLSSKNDINHALVLVGYGSDAAAGDYWILKNSYSSSWGENGFIKLLADNKTNCGLNIFPVVPIGAKAGVAQSVVDGGGEKLFVGLSPSAWLILATSTAVITTLLTVIGVLWVKRQRAALRAQTSGTAYVAYR